MPLYVTITNNNHNVTDEVSVTDGFCPNVCLLPLSEVRSKTVM